MQALPQAQEVRGEGMSKVIRPAQGIALGIVDRLFKDLRERQTLKHLFAEGDACDKIPNDVQDEIRDAWREMIVSQLRKAGLTE